MSYFNPVTLKFSNPNILCQQPGQPAGAMSPCGVANQADNARSMNEMRLALQNIKSTVVTTPPGALQFSATTFATTEGAGMATVTVQRVGGSAGTISINYATQDGTALAGSDYTATSGTLTWANGDATNKTFTVPIANDGIAEGTESFNVILSSPGGTAGAFIGNPATAVVTILPPEVFPPNCNMPAGWVKPGTTPYGWSVATDRARTGSCSLKSDAMPAAAQAGAANSNKAQISVTGNYQAGNVSFYFNTLSEANFDCLRFLVDGVQQTQMGACAGIGGSGASGNISTWTQVTVPVNAGIRTFTWSYEKDEQISPVGDASWIDDVTLPAAAPVTLTVARTGTGSGTITGTGINCGADCTEDVPSGTTVTLTASASPGSMFSGWSGGGCSGNGTCAVTVNTATTVSATFTLMQANLSVNLDGSGTGNVTSSPAGINTGTGSSSFAFNVGTVVTLTAVASGGSTFAGWSGGGCSGTGTCVVTMSTATSVMATFNAVLTAPGAPTIGTINAGNGQAIVNFTAPASNGGSPITGYTATCNTGGFTATGSVSPITVNELTNGVTYNCSVTATNAIGTSVPSTTGSVTPSAGAPVALVSVFSRKVHGAAGPFELTIDSSIGVGGLVTVEPRAIGSGHLIVFRFSGPITSTGTVALLDPNNPFGGVSAMMSGNDVLVTLTGVPDNRRARVTLTGVNGTTNAAANIGFLVGDVGRNRSVAASDVAAIKARVGQTLTLTNYLSDLNLSGTITNNDVSTAKARSGLTLP